MRDVDVAGMPTTGNALKGVLLIMTTVFIFAVADVVNKHLAMRYPVPLVQAVRYLVNLAILFVLLWPRHRTALWRTQRTGLVLFRGIFLAAASLTMGLALRLMPVGETVAIVYVTPFAVMILAGPILGERAGLIAWIGATIGFLGILLIVRPGSGLLPLGVAFAVANAACATAYHLSTRVLVHSESTMAMLFHVALVGAVVFCVLAVPDLNGAIPQPTDLALMALLGLLSAVGHFLFTQAYREAPASLLAPVNYFHLVWAGLLGWLVFDHIPDAPSLAGMGLVAGAGMIVAVYSHRKPG